MASVTHGRYSHHTSIAIASIAMVSTAIVSIAMVSTAMVSIAIVSIPVMRSTPAADRSYLVRVRVQVRVGVRVGVGVGTRVRVGVGLRVRGLEVEAALEHLQRHAVDGGNVVQAEHALCWHVAEETDLLPRGQRHLV